MIFSLMSVSRFANVDALGHALLLLFTQLDGGNVLLRGLAFSQVGETQKIPSFSMNNIETTQLHLIAKHHKKTPYLLISPYMARISTFVVTRAPEQPNILIETCRFLALSPPDFLSMTLVHTLPVLFGLQNLVALNSISKKLGKSKTSLFLVASSEILSHIFLLKNQEETESALSFVLETLGETVNKSNVSLHNIIRSCIIPLLGRLVVATGSDNQEFSQNVRGIFIV